MLKIELIGLKTALYDDIRSSLLNYIDIYQNKFELIETNDLGSILSSGYASIPLVMFDKRKFYFNENELGIKFSELNGHLVAHSKKTKTHNCKNCGSCKCPPKISMEENSDA